MTTNKKVGNIMFEKLNLEIEELYRTEHLDIINVHKEFKKLIFNLDGDNGDAIKSMFELATSYYKALSQLLKVDTLVVPSLSEDGSVLYLAKTNGEIIPNSIYDIDEDLKIMIFDGSEYYDNID